jgi:hypothetical protein
MEFNLAQDFQRLSFNYCSSKIARSSTATSATGAAAAVTLVGWLLEYRRRVLPISRAYKHLEDVLNSSCGARYDLKHGFETVCEAAVFRGDTVKLEPPVKQRKAAGTGFDGQLHTQRPSQRETCRQCNQSQAVKPVLRKSAWRSSSTTSVARLHRLARRKYTRKHERKSPSTYVVTKKNQRSQLKSTRTNLL